MFLADTIDWLGIAVSVSGAIIVAPAGFAEFIRSIRDGLRRLTWWILRREPTRHHASAKREPWSAFSVWVSGHYRKHDENATIAELAEAINGLRDDLTRLRADARKREKELRRQFAMSMDELSASNSEVKGRIEQAERDTARFNARGFPLIALGAVMTGTSGILAECIPVGCCCVAAGLFLIGYGFWPWRDQNVRG
jgi:hypothetical protein